MSRYSKGAIILHWVMAVMIIGNLAGGFLHDFVPNDAGQRSLVMGLHKSFGLTIIGLTLVRLGWRIANPPPAFPHYFTGGERLLARAAHGAFYLAMLAIPLSGWVMADRNTRPLPFFGLFEVPKFGVDKGIADAAHELHEILGWAMLALIALHLLGLLKHLLLDRDNLLVRMGLGKGRAAARA
ncbi:MAG: cytochrome b [Alphaproteobacteria bacterium]|nr:cytochrome b [Alphaproteobacteria bacterium]